MKIGMQAWGSHGDIRPMLALAEGLQAAGNEVHLVLTCVDSDAYRHIVSPQGVRISVLASPVVEPAKGEEFSRIAYTMRNPVAQMAALLRVAYAPVEDRMFEAARQLCRESDLLIGHYFMHPLQIAAQEAGRPHVACGHPERFQPSVRQRRVEQDGLTSAGLARRIRHVLATPAMTARAQEIGAGMREEDGVAAAVGLILRRFGGQLAPADALVPAA